MATPQTKSHYTLRNVRVFDGSRICEPSTIYIANGYIVAGDNTEAKDAKIIDCKNDILLPGFIDAHIHVESKETLKQLSSYGITTALDMGTWPSKTVESLRSLPGVTDLLSSGLIATAPGSKHSCIPGLPLEAQIESTQQAQDFVSRRIREKSDYIKIIADVPGPSQEVISTLVESAKKEGKLSIAHASTNAAFLMAQIANVAVITHAPLEDILKDDVIGNMKKQGIVCIPTLTMMEGIAKKVPISIIKFSNARASVKAMYEAGIPILVGTDSNAQFGVPFSPPFGESMHHEMELLEEAGMSNLDILNGATRHVADVFGLGDRGVVGVGMRADLVLLGGDPLGNIRETRNIRRVWCGGVEVKVAKY